MRNLSYLFILLFLFSCERESKEEFDGPDLNDLFGPFEVLTDITVNQNSVDFSVGQEIFWTGELSKSTDWIITLTGQNSGAKRTLTGNDRVISITNSTWTGEANAYPSFAIEDVNVEINFPNEEDSELITDVISVTGLRIETGTLASSFEDEIGENWTFFNQPGVTGQIVCGDNQAASGDCYYSISGTVNWDWGIGSFVIVPGDEGFGLQNSPTNLYFNMAYQAIENVGEGNSIVNFTFYEDENQDGTYDANSEDRFSFGYTNQQEGWELISYLYNDMKTFDVLGNEIDPVGNGIKEPSKLYSVEVWFVANEDGGLSTAYFDQLIFTTDEPYMP